MYECECYIAFKLYFITFQMKFGQKICELFVKCSGIILNITAQTGNI